MRESEDTHQAQKRQLQQQIAEDENKLKKLREIVQGWVSRTREGLKIFAGMDAAAQTKSKESFDAEIAKLKEWIDEVNQKIMKLEKAKSSNKNKLWRLNHGV